MVMTYLGLGTNLGDRMAQLERAIGELAVRLEITAVSSVYETAPWGRVDQPEFLNCCIGATTALAPSDLLDLAKDIEARLGRVASDRWGPRAIDIDVLLYGDETIGLPDLAVPHPRLRERAFVLVPLAEIAPDARIAGAGVTVREALASLARTPGDVRRVARPILAPRHAAQ